MTSISSVGFINVQSELNFNSQLETGKKNFLELAKFCSPEQKVMLLRKMMDFQNLEGVFTEIISLTAFFDFKHPLVSSPHFELYVLRGVIEGLLGINDAATLLLFKAVLAEPGVNPSEIRIISLDMDGEIATRILRATIGGSENKIPLISEEQLEEVVNQLAIHSPIQHSFAIYPLPNGEAVKKKVNSREFALFSYLEIEGRPYGVVPSFSLITSLFKTVFKESGLEIQPVLFSSFSDWDILNDQSERNKRPFGIPLMELSREKPLGIHGSSLDKVREQFYRAFLASGTTKAERNIIMKVAYDHLEVSRKIIPSNKSQSLLKELNFELAEKLVRLKFHYHRSDWPLASEMKEFPESTFLLFFHIAELLEEIIHHIFKKSVLDLTMSPVQIFEQEIDWRRKIVQIGFFNIVYKKFDNPKMRQAIDCYRVAKKIYHLKKGFKLDQGIDLQNLFFFSPQKELIKFFSPPLLKRSKDWFNAIKSHLSVKEVISLREQSKGLGTTLGPAYSFPKINWELDDDYTIRKMLETKQGKISLEEFFTSQIVKLASLHNEFEEGEEKRFFLGEGGNGVKVLSAILNYLMPTLFSEADLSEIARIMQLPVISPSERWFLLLPYKAEMEPKEKWNLPLAKRMGVLNIDGEFCAFLPSFTLLNVILEAKFKENAFSLLPTLMNSPIYIETNMKIVELPLFFLEPKGQMTIDGRSCKPLEIVYTAFSVAWESSAGA